MRVGKILWVGLCLTVAGSTMTVSNVLEADTNSPLVVSDVQYIMDDYQNLTVEYPEVSYPQDTLDLSLEMFDELECFAKNIYFEAGNQELAGKYAVGHVVLNRVMSEKFPDDICGVIYQGPVRESWKTANDHTLEEHERVYYPRRHQCQFSWYCDGLADDPFEGENWERSVEIAQEMLFDFHSGEKMVDITDGALYYHANYVNPYWAKTMKVVAHIGDHIFYR
jgi:spore germination cell wall hydrolase CwlJ-like protein